MTPESFCYWLQGYLEIATASDAPVDMTDEQVRCIKDHLALVFEKITPKRGKAKAEIVVDEFESSSGSTTAPTTEDLMKLVKESAKKHKAIRPSNQTHRWVGGDPIGRKYC